VKARTLVLSLFLLCFAIAAAHATPIVYSVTGTATGTLGGSTFTDQLLTIAFAGDTDNVTGGSGFYTNGTGTGTVLLNGTTVATFTEAVYFFDNQGFSPSTAGIGDGQGSIFDTFNSAFASYTGSTEIGPLSGGAFIRPDLSFSTTAGLFNISSVSGDSTFLATTTAAAPEPSSFLLLATGVLGTATAMRRKLAGLR
jgi:hypothetical protein